MLIEFVTEAIWPDRDVRGSMTFDTTHHENHPTDEAFHVAIHRTIREEFRRLGAIEVRTRRRGQVESTIAEDA